MGQCAEAGVKIDELKRAISWVSELIAKIDGPLSLVDTSPRSSYLTKFSPPPSIPVIPSVSPERHSPSYSTPTATIDPSAMVDVQSHLDVSDGSRKRCASSMAGEVGDRVIKAPKREPQEDVLVIPPTNLQSFSNSGVSLSGLSSSVLAGPRPVPTSAPPSRPPTPGGLVSQKLSLLQQHPAPIKFSHIHAPAPSSADFGPISNQAAPPAFPLGPRNRSSWSDTTAAFPHRQHQHSLSLGGLNGNVNMHGLGSLLTSALFFSHWNIWGPLRKFADQAEARNERWHDDQSAFRPNSTFRVCDRCAKSILIWISRSFHVRFI
jgi:hypothetical protein